MGLIDSDTEDAQIIVDRESLTNFGTRVLMTHGVSEENARLVSESLVVADVWGHPSHGMLRLPWYTARLESGAMRAATEVEVVTDTGPVAVIDGHDGIGQVITDSACRMAGERAKTFGVGVVAVRHSNHFGTAAYWTRRMAAAGAVGILTTNGSPAMAPWGGAEKTVGANPWSIAVPSGKFGPVALDIANTSVARGKIYAAHQRGEPIPEGWAVGPNGLPTTDPRAAVEGILSPVGGHKGYGISFMMDVLSGVLTGSRYSTDVVGPYSPEGSSGCGHLIIALDIETISGTEDFDARMDDLVSKTKSVRRAPGVEEIFAPGEKETRAEAGANSEVVLPKKTIDDLSREAAGLRIEVPWRSDAGQADKERPIPC